MKAHTPSHIARKWPSQDLKLQLSIGAETAPLPHAVSGAKSVVFKSVPSRGWRMGQWTSTAPWPSPRQGPSNEQGPSFPAPCLKRDLPRLVSEAGNHNLLATCTPVRCSGPSARLGCSEQELKASEKVQAVPPEEGQS